MRVCMEGASTSSVCGGDSSSSDYSDSEEPKGDEDTAVSLLDVPKAPRVSKLKVLKNCGPGKRRKTSSSTSSDPAAKSERKCFKGQAVL